MRLWHSGLPVDTGNKRDAGSRFGATINDVPITYYLRDSPLLSDVPGAARSLIDVFVDSKSGCPDRAFKPLGTWTVTIPL